MVKSIISWILAFFISLLIVWMFWTLLIPGDESFFNVLLKDSLVFIMFSFIMFVVAIPVFMIVRKKLIK
jgi:hypothetical protein